MFVFAALFASQISPYDPAKPNFKALMQIAKSRPSLRYGRQRHETSLLRVVYGTRFHSRSRLFGLAGNLIGLPLGLVSGYFGGFADSLISRFVDALFAFPPISDGDCDHVHSWQGRSERDDRDRT